jgi:hypothetical protein
MGSGDTLLNSTSRTHLPAIIGLGVPGIPPRGLRMPAIRTRICDVLERNRRIARCVRCIDIDAWPWRKRSDTAGVPVTRCQATVKLPPSAIVKLGVQTRPQFVTSSRTSFWRHHIIGLFASLIRLLGKPPKPKTGPGPPSLLSLRSGSKRRFVAPRSLSATAWASSVPCHVEPRIGKGRLHERASPQASLRDQER